MVAVGPPMDVLTGEQVAVGSRRTLGRRGRGVVHSRIIGNASVGWAEAASLWGCVMEAIVVTQGRLKHLNHLLFPNVPTLCQSEASRLTPLHSDWDGIALGTLLNLDDQQLFQHLFLRWRPAISVVAVPGNLSRKNVINLFTYLPPKYQKRIFTARHPDFGGVTTSRWHIVKISRLSKPLTVMTMSNYPRTLQTALDDTVGTDSEKVTFEPQEGLAQNVVGFIRHRKCRWKAHVFDSNGLGPDLFAWGQKPTDLWVRARSVMSKHPIIRRIQMSEIGAMWDYESKSWSRNNPEVSLAEMTSLRVESPPGKILRAYAFESFEDMNQDDILTPDSPSSHAYLPGTLSTDIRFKPLEEATDTRVAAALSDYAEVDLSNWALKDETEEQSKARIVLRRFAVRWWKTNLAREGQAWLRNNGNHKQDALAIKDCIARANAATYWTWVRGSRLFFWRFPKEWQADARDGVEFWHLKDPPKGMAHNYPAKSRETELAVREKVFKLVFQWYLEPGFVDLIVPRFDVEKTKDDIRAVWNCKSNGLNATLWAPKFMLPEFLDVENMVVKWLPCSVGKHLEAGSPAQDYTSLSPEELIASYQVDNDVGGMFHNFIMHHKERHTMGARYIKTRNDGSHEEHEILRWKTLNFGGKCSPYLAYQGQVRILELCQGDRHDHNNPFQWESVYLNLPTEIGYDPSMPRVMLLRKDGELATRLVVFVDDIHTVGRGKEATTQASRTLGKRMVYHGNQNSERKWRVSSLSPGAWNGSILNCVTPYPRKSTTGKKWKRFRNFLQWVLEAAQTSEYIDTAELRRGAGLGVNVTEAHPHGRPYLKGFFNAIEAFRFGRDMDGWRLDDAMLAAQDLEFNDEGRAQALEGYPSETRITDELKLHTQALLDIFCEEDPIPEAIRPKEKNDVRFNIADASAEGFGSATQYPDLELSGRDGLWDPIFADGGSNLREAQNVVNHLLWEINQGLHTGCEVWSFTDNSVWSSVFNKGMSKAKHLFALVVKLRKAARKFEVFIHVVHVSGERMIASGMDGWSRGDYDAGISLGFDLRLFIPLGVSAFDVKGNQLRDWCKSWMRRDFSPPLTPEGWFSLGHLKGIHVWAPPPAAALVALKELATSKLKRPYDVTHVVIIPRLMYQEEWSKRFQKEMDLWFVLHPGTFWPHSAFEPLMVGISFPLRRTRPWRISQLREEVVGAGRALSEMSKTSHLRVGDYLRQLWQTPGEIQSLQERLVC